MMHKDEIVWWLPFTDIQPAILGSADEEEEYPRNVNIPESEGSRDVQGPELNSLR